MGAVEDTFYAQVTLKLIKNVCLDDTLDEF